MKKVLIALDYDPSAQKVAEIGFSLAGNIKAAITLIHVITNPADYDSTKHITIMGFAGRRDIDPLKLDDTEELKNIARLFLETSKEHLGDESIQTRVDEGDVAESILKAAKDWEADIIVMGSHGRKWQQNTVVGSVTEKVLHHTLVPVFIIPVNHNR